MIISCVLCSIDYITKVLTAGTLILFSSLFRYYAVGTMVCNFTLKYDTYEKVQTMNVGTSFKILIIIK